MGWGDVPSAVMVRSSGRRTTWAGGLWGATGSRADRGSHCGFVRAGSESDPAPKRRAQHGQQCLRAVVALPVSPMVRAVDSLSRRAAIRTGVRSRLVDQRVK